MIKPKILINSILGIFFLFVFLFGNVKVSYAANCVVSWSVSNENPAANQEISVSVTQQPGSSSGVKWVNVHLYLDNTQDGITFVNFDNGSRTSNYKVNSRSAGSHTLKFTTDGNVTDSNASTGIACTLTKTINTQSSGSSSSKIYVSPELVRPGESAVVTFTASTDCSTYIDTSDGSGLTGCADDGGGTCTGANPTNDGNPCWWRHKCTAINASSSQTFTASFGVHAPNPNGAACAATKTYTVAPAAPAVTTKWYRVAENPADFSETGPHGWQNYESDGMAVDYDFKTSGQKFIFVEFKDSAGNKGGCGEKKDQPCQAEIKVLGDGPAIAGCLLSFEGNNTILNLTGQNFGSTKGSVKSDDKALDTRKWKNDSVQAIWSGDSAGEKIPVVLTNTDGQASEEIQCSATSQLSLGAKVFCRAPSSSNTNNVDLTLVGAFAGGTKVKQKVTVDKDGVIQGLSQKLEEGKEYKLSLKAPKSVRKTVPFTAGSGTTTIPNFVLPIGDIFPADGGDGKINVSDKAELNRQWIIAGDATGRSGDFNGDGRVNSIDWACMIHDYGSADDAEPEPGGPPPAATASPSPTTSPTVAPSASAAVTVDACTNDSSCGVGRKCQIQNCPVETTTCPSVCVTDVNAVQCSSDGGCTNNYSCQQNVCRPRLKPLPSSSVNLL